MKTYSILPENADISGVLVLPTDLVPDYYQSFFKYENCHMWSLQRPARHSVMVNCKTQRGLTCIGFGGNVSPDFSFRKTSASLQQPKNQMMDQPENDEFHQIHFSKKIKFN